MQEYDIEMFSGKNSIQALKNRIDRLKQIEIILLIYDTVLTYSLDQINN